MTAPSEFAERFAKAIEQKFNRVVDEENATRKYKHQHVAVTVEPGRKYDRIVLDTSVHAFIRREDGALIKAASYAKPQQDKDGDAVRFDLGIPQMFGYALSVADRYGSYLYKR